MRVAFFHCFSGASGDMILGSLVDAGLDSSLISQELEKLSLPPYTLSFKKTLRAGIAGTRFDVIPDKRPEGHRSFDDIYRLIETSKLQEKIRTDSLRVLRRLGEAEARVHNTTLEGVVFHEIGALDSIIDIVGSVVGLEKLGIKEVFFTPLPAGSGYVDCEHGRLPAPAPITLELLKGHKIASSPVEGELTTPTGAAILTTLGKEVEACPELSIEGVGYGAGTRDNPEMPNLLRVLVGEISLESQRDEMWVVETNIDDMTGELCGYVSEKLFEAGAVDVYTTAIQMKKNRPGFLLTAIVPELRKDAVEEVFFQESTTFGVRAYRVFRKILNRQAAEVETPYGKVKVKVGRLNGHVKSVSPEYEDCRRVAEERGIPLRLIYEAAMEATKGL